MQQLLDNLGINWELLLSQAVNFALLLIVLRIFVYKPVIGVSGSKGDWRRPTRLSAVFMK
jgi:hypothetical protein